MKTILTAGVAFAPGQRQLDFTGRAAFDVRRLMAVLHETSGRTLYRKGKPGYGAAVSADGRVLTLAQDTTTLAPGDTLTVFYERADRALPVASPASGYVKVTAGAGALVGFDVFNLSAYPRTLALYDAASGPGPGAAPLYATTLAGAARAALTLPAGITFAAGLWLSAAGRANQPTPATGDVSGSIIV